MVFILVKTLFAAALCLSTAVNAAAPWQITDPVASTVWKSGDTVNVVWTTDGSIRASSIQIELLAGNTLFDKVSKSVAPNALKAPYIVRKGFVSSDQYYLRIGTGASDFTYSHTFSIQGEGTLVPGKLPPNTTAVITGGAAAPASPSGTSSGTGSGNGTAVSSSPSAKTSSPSASSADATNSTGSSNSTTSVKSSAVRPVNELKSISFVIALVAAVAFWGV